jgi:hypothetical protein
VSLNNALGARIRELRPDTPFPFGEGIGKRVRELRIDRGLSQREVEEPGL